MRQPRRGLPLGPHCSGFASVQQRPAATTRAARHGSSCVGRRNGRWQSAWRTSCARQPTGPVFPAPSLVRSGALHQSARRIRARDRTPWTAPARNEKPLVIVSDRERLSCCFIPILTGPLGTCSSGISADYRRRRIASPPRPSSASVAGSGTWIAPSRSPFGKPPYQYQ